MPFFQGSSNVNINNSNFNQIHGNVISFRFDGRFSENDKDLITDSITTLPDISTTSKKQALCPPIVNLPRTQAAYNDYQAKKQSGPCFKGTREVLLQDMEEWVSKQDDTQIYVLSGLAGMGKSTVAYTLASRADEAGLLGASFFFSRDEEDRKNAKKFFTTLAFQLCIYNEVFANAIAGALLEKRGAAAMTQKPQEQLQALILEPLKGIEAPPTRTTLIVVDALDECDDKDVILTTRPKQQLEYYYANKPIKTVFHLQDIEAKVVDNDIRLYLKYNLSQEQVREHLHDHTEEWHASDDEIESLVLAVGRLFIIASTSIRFILNTKVADPGSRMTRLLDSYAQGRTPFSDLNNFYMVILQNAVDGDDEEIVDCYQAVVGAIALIENPISVTALAQLINRSEKSIRAILRNLQSIILLGNDDIPVIYHKSFTDYITDCARCKDDVIRIDPRLHNTQLSIHCFRVMNKHLKQNILNLGDPARFMENEEGLAYEKISDELFYEKIPSELRYACVYWAQHLDAAEMEKSDLTQVFETFTYEHLLHWLEILSWTKSLGIADRALGVVLKRFTLSSSDLRQLLADGQLFVNKFYEIIQHSALHTYYSALSFTPTESHLYRRYQKEILHNFCQVLGGAEKWDNLLAAPTHGESVVCVEFSPDNTMFASWSPGVLKIWDAKTGAPTFLIPGVDFVQISSNFSFAATINDNNVTLYDVRRKINVPVFAFPPSTEIVALALSPNGSRVAVGLVDNTVGLLDSEKCLIITSLEDFAYSEEEDESEDEEEETEEENSEFDEEVEDDDEGEGNGLDILAFSSSGSRLAYRSVTGSIKLCSGVNGEFVADLDYQSEVQTGFLYTQDGSRIAALSEKGTLTLWDSVGGQLIGARNNTGNMLAISVDGSLFASAQHNIVCLRDGNLQPLDLLNDILDEINALAFSQNRLLAIAQRDQVMLYSVDDRLFSSPLFIIYPTALAFSPDCKRVIAGNLEGDLHLWNMSNIKLPGSTLANEDEGSISVARLALSHTSCQLACGFRDDKVELWNTKPTPPTKQLVVANNGYMDSISSLTFSSDGMLLASRFVDGSITLWKTIDGVPAVRLETFYLLEVDPRASDVTNDAMNVDSTSDTGSEASTPQSSDSIDLTEPEAIALSSDLLAAAVSDGIQLWDLKTMNFVGILKEPDSVLLAFSAHGDLLACYGSEHGTVTVFDIVKRTAISSFKVDDDIDMMGFLLDNSRLVVRFLDEKFQSFDLTDKILQEARLEHLRQLPCISCWHGIPVWLGAENVVKGLFSQDGTCVPVLLVPADIGITCYSQVSSMIALGCKAGRVIRLQAAITGDYKQ